jgi:ethanolamine utilization protein EutA
VRIAERRVFHRRGPIPVPYLSDGRIDIGALGFAILEAGAASPILGDGIDGRVAVLSGQAAEEGNAYWIRRALADIDYGDFTMVRAGPHLGAVLAAYGADAVTRSIDPHGEPRAVLNVDLGATTAKLALCVNGAIAETTAIAIGTRLVAFAPDGRVAEIRPAGATIAGAAGVRLENGVEVEPSQRQAFAAQVAECLFNVLERRALEPVTESLMLGAPLAYSGKINAVSFTGGGAEYIFENQDRDFGDLGRLLGRAIRQRINRLGTAVQEPEHLGRAALIGGIQYHVHDPHDPPHFAEPPAFAAARERDRGFVGADQGALVFG